MDHADFGSDRIERRIEADRFAVDVHRALVGRVNPVEDSHQRRFTRAVFPDYRVNLAAFDLEVYVVVGDYAGKAFGDSGQFDG